MSSEVAIRATDLSKAYALFGKPKDRLKQMLLRGRRKYYRDFWALRDVSLEVRRGETVGVIGANGSGKSTLLQLVCGNLTQTQGEIMVSGRVSALLELGAGFNPHFTGRENVFVSGAIRGYEEGEINERFAEIEAFADIGDFINQPVKTYSSGMYARLAFAVAISVEPDILLVDEVLAVGDEAFKRKCHARIEQIRGGDGTILFVSHSPKAVVELCDRAVLLHSGQRLYTGNPKEAIGLYQKLINSPSEYNDEICAEIREKDAASPVHDDSGPAVENMDVQGRELRSLTPSFSDAISDLTESDFKFNKPDFDPHLVSKSTISYRPSGAEISNPRLLDKSGQQVNCLVNGERYRFCFDVVFDEDPGSVHFYTMIGTKSGINLGGGQYPDSESPGIKFHNGQQAVISFEFQCALNVGVYFMNCHVRNHEARSLHRIIDALAFRVNKRSVVFSTGVVDFCYMPELSVAAP